MKIFKASIFLISLLFSVQVHAMDYVASPSCADHASTATGCTKALLNAIGTTKKATIVYNHNSNGTTTTYTVGQNADWSAYTNVTFEIVPGAVITPAANVIVTIPSIDESGLYQRFDCSASGSKILLLSSKGIYPNWWGYSTTATAASNAVSMLKALTCSLTGSFKLTIPSGVYLQAPVTINNATSPNWVILDIEGETSTTSEMTYGAATNVGVKIKTNGTSAFLIYMDTASYYPMQESINIKNLSIVNSGAMGTTEGIALTLDSANFPRDMNFDRLSFYGFDSGMHLTVTPTGYGFGTMVFNHYNVSTCNQGLRFTGGITYGVFADLLTIRDSLFHGIAKGGLVLDGGCPVTGSIYDTNFSGCNPAGIVMGGGASVLNLVQVTGEVTGTLGTGRGIIDTTATGALVLNIFGGYHSLMPFEYRLNEHCLINSSTPIRVSGHGWKTNTPETITPVVSNNATYGQTDTYTYFLSPLPISKGRRGNKVFEAFAGDIGYSQASSLLPDALRTDYVGATGIVNNGIATYTAPSAGYIYSTFLASFAAGSASGFSVANFVIDGTDLGITGGFDSFTGEQGAFTIVAPIASGKVLSAMALQTYSHLWYTPAWTTFEPTLLTAAEAAVGHPRKVTKYYTVLNTVTKTFHDIGTGSVPYSVRVRLSFNAGALGVFEYLVRGGGTTATRTYVTVINSIAAGIAVAPNAGVGQADLFLIDFTNTTGGTVVVTEEVEYLN